MGGRRESWSFACPGGGFAARSWRSFGSSGNRAFDEWRAGELGRLEEERRKLVAAEREFAEFLEQLRRARDREEFYRFMAGAALAAGDDFGLIPEPICKVLRAPPSGRPFF